jgi:penicillin-binding protein 1C
LAQIRQDTTTPQAEKRWYWLFVPKKRAKTVAAIVAGLLLLTAGVWFYRCLPEPLFDVPYSTVIEDRNGALLGARTAADEQWRFPLASALPDKYTTALLLFEDKRFFRHPGIDVLAMARAVRQNLRSERVVSGASTLSMQVIRLSSGNPPRTYSRKLLEVIQAFRLELRYSKDEILALYAAHAPFGGNVVGLEAASWRYFGHAADELSWAEAAMLAVLPNSPALMHPGRNRNALTQKRDRLLQRLHQNGSIDELTLRLALLETIPEVSVALPRLAPHLLDRVATGAQSGTQVRTTIDAGLQQRAGEVIERHYNMLRLNEIHNAAALIADVRTGEVLAYIGNTPGPSESRQRAHMVDITQAPRSTGSILKPILFTLMMQDGMLLPDMLVADVPTSISDYSPQNFSRTYMGAVPASEVVSRSLNVPSVRMLQQYGLGRFYHYLQQMGMQTLNRPPEHYGLTLILGGAEGSLWDITGMYTSLVRHLGENRRSGSYDFHPESLYFVKQLGHSVEGALSQTDVRSPGSDHFAIPTQKDPRIQSVSQHVTLPMQQDIDQSWSQSAIYTLQHDQMNYQSIAAKLIESRDDPLAQSTNLPRTGFRLSPGVVWAMMEAMREVTRPEGEVDWRRFDSARQVAWKTGTSFGNRDAWAIGMTPEFVIGVWVGNAGGEGRPDLTGVRSAGPIMFDLFNIMGATTWFQEPIRDTRSVEICTRSGHRAGSHCPETEYRLIPLTALETPACPYHQRIHVTGNPPERADSRCVPPSELQPVSHFTLPPSMALYYRRLNPTYQSLPPWKQGCAPEQGAATVIEMIYPPEGARIYVPVELDGARGRVVFEAAHERPSARLFWHLNDRYLGFTTDIHQMGLAPEPGWYTLTLVDENGERLERRIQILGR